MVTVLCTDAQQLKTPKLKRKRKKKKNGLVINQLNFFPDHI